ncbi:MAG: hypothetical protein HKN47_22080 [Pirellulaceae bacterium]|nr:hypothetical protein [Pirellulaceae bacterium]
MKRLSFLLLVTSIAIVYRVHGNNQRITKQTDAQERSVRQILALGGDWEAPSKTLLIGFIGQNFTDDTFALLTPLVDVQILYFSDLPAKDVALIHCRGLRDVRQVQVKSCAFTGVGFKHFAKAKKLKRLFIEDAPITDDGLASIAMLTNLQILDITCSESPTEITIAGLRKLRSLTKLRDLFVTMSDPSPEMEAELRRLLPQCKHVNLVPNPKGTTIADLRSQHAAP